MKRGEYMKKFTMLSVVLMIFILTACGNRTSYTKPAVKPESKTYHSESDKSYGSNSYSNSYKEKSNKSSATEYDYDKGYGYTAPKEGESLSEYIQRQDPELYNDMKKKYNSLK